MIRWCRLGCLRVLVFDDDDDGCGCDRIGVVVAIDGRCLHVRRIQCRWQVPIQSEMVGQFLGTDQCDKLQPFRCVVGDGLEMLPDPLR